MRKFHFSTILDKPYQMGSQDEEEKEITQLAEIHHRTHEDETKRTLVKSVLGLKSEEKEEIEKLFRVHIVGCGTRVSRHPSACPEGRPSIYAQYSSAGAISNVIFSTCFTTVLY